MGDAHGEMQVLCSMGTFYDDLGNPEQTERVYLEAYEMVLRCGDRIREAGVLANLGLFYMVNGRFGESLRCSQAAIVCARKCGNVLGIAIAEGNLGNLYHEMGERGRARRYIEGAIVQCDLAEPFAAGAFRGSLALISAEEGDFETAAALFEQAEVQLRKTHAGELGKMLCKKGLVALLAHRPDDVEAHLAEAEQIGRDLGAGDRSELGLAIAHLTVSQRCPLRKSFIPSRRQSLHLGPVYLDMAAPRPDVFSWDDNRYEAAV